MPVADLSKSSFGNDPTVLPLVIDAYDADKIAALLTPAAIESSDSLTSLYPNIAADKISGVLLSTVVSSYLVKHNTTVNALVALTMNAVPSSVDFNDYLDSHDLTVIFSFAKAYSLYVSSSVWANVTDAMFSTGINSYGGFKTLLENPDNYDTYLEALNLGDTSGILEAMGLTEVSTYIDTVMAATHTYVIGTVMLDAGFETNIVGFVGGVELLDVTFTQAVYGKLILPAARYNFGELVIELIGLAGTFYTETMVSDTIRAMLEGYVKPSTLLPSGNDAEADLLVSRLDIVDANWDTVTRDGTDVRNTRMFEIASDDAKDILRYNDRVRFAANLMYTRRVAMISVEAKISTQHPLVFM